ncbi:MAG: DUF4838 domain-containing protein [Bacteroidota bacterium]
MKKLITLLCLALLILSGRTFAKQLVVTEGSQTYYTIVVADTADSSTLSAASVLKESIFRMTGCWLQIEHQPAKKMKSLFIGSSWLQGKPVYQELQTLSAEGFYLYSEKGNYYLAGKQSTGDLYAVYTMLESCGFLQFSAREAWYPPTYKLVLEEISQGYQPDFSFRHAHFPDKDSPGFCIPNKTHSMNDWGLFVHTFQKLCPPDLYFDQHPEYFSQVNGRRIRDGQLCLSNPAVISLLTENLRKEINQKPECGYWSVSQNDCINYCECEHCQALYDKYGSVSGAYIELVNKIARQFPDKQISTLAYQFTRSAPKNIVPDPNVNIMFCSIECNRSQPLASDPRSRDFVRDMQDWAALTHNIFMWDYVVQFKTYTCPFPNSGMLQQNIQFFHQYGVPMMFQQGSGSSWSDFSEYKQSLIAHLLWDTGLDETAYRQKFFDAYYGAAAPAMLAYFGTVQEEMNARAEDRNLDIYGYPVMYADWFLKPELLIGYKALMDEAEGLVSRDPERLKRVKRERCSVDFACLDVALNVNDPILTFYSQGNDGWEINPEMALLLDRFVENCKTTGILSIDENGYTPEQYRTQTLNIVSMALKPNKAALKNITSLTTYSPLYDVGGAKALTDGLFGGQHFRLNWLGYQGNDMELLIDFGHTETFSKLETNFFLDLVSWIFLPLQVKIEVSGDNQAFRQVYLQDIAELARNNGQKPVHFSFGFPETNARYMKLTAISRKTCPDWHRGAGQPSWIFLDEVVVE